MIYMYVVNEKNTGTIYDTYCSVGLIIPVFYISLNFICALSFFPEENVQLLLRLANEFKVKTLRERCVAFMKLQLENNCSSDRIIEILTLSINFDLEELQRLSTERACRASSEELENVPGFSELPDDIIYSITRQRLNLYEDAGRKIRKRLKEAETHCSLYHKNERWGDNLCNKCLAGVGKVSSYEIEKLF